MRRYPTTNSEMETRIYEAALEKAKSIISDSEMLDVAVDYNWPTFGRGSEPVAMVTSRYLVALKRSKHGWEAIGIRFPKE